MTGLIRGVTAVIDGRDAMQLWHALSESGALPGLRLKGDGVMRALAAVHAADQEYRTRATSDAGTGPRNSAEVASEWMTSGEAARALHVTPEWIRQMCRAGDLDGRQNSSGFWEVSRNSIEIRRTRR